MLNVFIERDYCVRGPLLNAGNIADYCGEETYKSLFSWVDDNM